MLPPEFLASTVLCEGWHILNFVEKPLFTANSATINMREKTQKHGPDLSSETATCDSTLRGQVTFECCPVIRRRGSNSD